MRVSSKKPTHVDEHVGKRLRLRRNLLGLSQDDLARRIGLTSQLIQKYEAGETRISASRLYGIATQLAVPITWFFDELEGKRRPSAESKQASSKQALSKQALSKQALETADWSELVTKRESRQLLELYFGIADERLRRKLMEVAQLLKTTEPD
ncbi:helix-turn-helix domain-containing protein [Bradyrhizobium roseum]|uniref:helix-turn-helix domain-containing protein n=1 Tax=Bradyrhizobium roseum TaxID=3056648 RepID=UPI00262027E8|nr:helix-turn-helix transcriptional regulator [Bradyrhizobium roseus]WKA30474.1 helix-turn-helix transcriptional regulator [Bradyrhizobium roseus]